MSIDIKRGRKILDALAGGARPQAQDLDVLVGLLDTLERMWDQRRHEYFQASLQGILARPIRWRKPYSDTIQKAGTYAELALRYASEEFPVPRGEDS